MQNIYSRYQQWSAWNYSVVHYLRFTVGPLHDIIHKMNGPFITAPLFQSGEKSLHQYIGNNDLCCLEERDQVYSDRLTVWVH